MTYQIVTDSEVLHRAETRGVVVTRVQIILINGTRYRATHWTQFETGKLHHIDSVEL